MAIMMSRYLVLALACVQLGICMGEFGRFANLEHHNWKIRKPN